MKLLIAALFFSVITNATAKPPEPGSQDAIDLAPYSSYLRGLHSPSGLPCCDLSDCRFVEAKVTNNHWRVLVRKEQFENGPNIWIDVPETAIVRNENPTGQPLLCWSPTRGILCFVQPAGV